MSSIDEHASINLGTLCSYTTLSSISFIILSETTARLTAVKTLPSSSLSNILISNNKRLINATTIISTVAGIKDMSIALFPTLFKNRDLNKSKYR